MLERLNMTNYATTPQPIINYGYGRTIVAAIDAEKMLAVTGNEKLREAAQQVNETLRRVIDAQ